VRHPLYRSILYILIVLTLMEYSSKRVQNVYLTLMLTNTLAASFIWGINTLFLLDAGLSNTQAFLANAFFTAGMVIFEIPTGIIADSWGRRTSYMLGTITLGISTILYYYAWQIHAPFILWVFSSLLLGFGFTFFSGATEAWLVDALQFTKFEGTLESVFAKGQIVGGISMLSGSVMGGLIAQFTNLGVPYIIRSAILGLSLIIAFYFMKDLGFKPEKSEGTLKDMKKIFTASVDHGLRNRPVRWVMLAAPFTAGVGFYAFYAMQPYLLELYGNSQAYGIAGLAAAIVAGAQIVGGLLVPQMKKIFKRRTTIFATATVINVLLLAFIGWTTSLVLAIVLLVVWALVFAANMPVRQAYLNQLIPSKQRATVLSFDSLIGSSGGIVIQPALGKVADVYSYSISFVVSAAIQIASLPFILLARKEKSKADEVK